MDPAVAALDLAKAGAIIAGEQLTPGALLSCRLDPQGCHSHFELHFDPVSLWARLR